MSWLRRVRSLRRRSPWSPASPPDSKISFSPALPRRGGGRRNSHEHELNGKEVRPGFKGRTF